MNPITCGMAADLLPLYLDGCCSADSRAALEAHMDACPACRAQYAQLRRDLTPAAPAAEDPGTDGIARALARKMRRRKRCLRALCAVLGVLLAVLLVFIGKTIVILGQPGGAVSAALPAGATDLVAREVSGTAEEVGEHMISSVEKLISAGCNMITICPCNDTMLIKVAKLCEENKVYWAVAWRDILDPEVRDVVYASPYFCGTAVQSDLNAGYAAVKAMGEAGMKKIGLISLDKSSSCAALREKGMQKALDEYGMQVVAEARDLQQAADAAQAVESFIVANPDLDGVYIACSMGMNILDGTLSALEQYDPDNHIKISVIDFLTGLDTCFEKDRIICAQGGIYIPVQIACGMLEMNAILNGGRLGGQAWDVPISFGAVGSAEEFKDYSKFCEGALPTYTFEELQNLFITYNPDVTGEDIIAWGNAFNLADIYAAHADLAAPVKGPNGVEYVPFAK